MLYNIAGLKIFFEGDNELFKERSSSFLQKSYDIKPEEYDMHISLEFSDNIEKPDGEEIINDNENVVIRRTSPEKGYYFFSENFEPDGGEPKKPSILESDLNWTNIKLKYSINNRLLKLIDYESLMIWIQHISFYTMNIAFRNRLIFMDGLQIHSSSIEYENKGLIFSAPSGTGKSTHANLWRELYGDKVTIINEDRPAIRYFNSAPMICGTPWSGKTCNFTNRIVPLDCIIILEQAPLNSIERLDTARALQLLMPRCFLPYFDMKLMDKAVDILEKIINDVPVYHLKCLPNYEAVELVQKCLK